MQGSKELPRYVIDSGLRVRAGPFTATLRDLHYAGVKMFIEDDYSHQRKHLIMEFRNDRRRGVGTVEHVAYGIPYEDLLWEDSDPRRLMHVIQATDLTLNFALTTITDREMRLSPVTIAYVQDVGSHHVVRELEPTNTDSQIIIADEPTVMEMLEKITAMQKPRAQELLRKEGELDRMKLKAKIISVAS